MSRRPRTLLVASALTLLLLVVAAFLPVPYVTLFPGPVTDTLGNVDGAPLITIDGTKTYPTTGRLDLTTVDEDPRATLVSAVRNWLSSDGAVVPKELLQPPGTSAQQVEQQNTQEMQDSQDQATAAALAQLGIKATGTYVSVAAVPTGSPSAGKLQAGDRIVSVDGTTITGATQLKDLITKAGVGAELKITYRRGAAADATVTVRTGSTRTAAGAQQAVVGIDTTQKNSYPFTVTIRLEDVGGPSAGLMFALGIIDRLTPGALTGGRVIAGTGTIDAKGAVGPIGGIQQKLLGARRSGATIFLVPADNCAEASGAVPGGLRLIKVTSLKDALADLTGLAAGKTDQPSC